MKKESVAIIDAFILFIFMRCCKSYISVLSKLICRRKMSLTGSTSSGFAQNTIHDFQNTLLELIVALSSTNVTTEPLTTFLARIVDEWR